jgi:hypothetical protein
MKTGMFHLITNTRQKVKKHLIKPIKPFVKIVGKQNIMNLKKLKSWMKQHFSDKESWKQKLLDIYNENNI